MTAPPSPDIAFGSAPPAAPTGAAAISATAARAFSVAPMMDWTDRWCRAFHRVLTRRALLFTEMVHAEAVIHGDRARLIGFDPVERPLALQLGGSSPATLAAAARIAADAGFDEINLNVGCPSERVQSGAFGACLMREPALVADCVAAMTAAVAVPVTVKCRIGVDDQDPSEALPAFVDAVAATGCRTFYVHARKAWLKGLSPKENREIPPLQYDVVRALKTARPELTVILNGGLANVAEARATASGLDGAMLGRAAYHDPWTLAAADAAFFGAPPAVASRREAVAAFSPFVARECARGVPLRWMSRHMLGLYNGRPGARAWRRTLAEEARDPNAGVDLLRRACDQVEAAGGGARRAPADAA